jgi:excisionase family DNA binding protein
MEPITIDESSLQRLGDIIAEKILYAKNRPEPWITIQDVAEKTGRSVGTLYRDVQQHGLPCIRGGRRLKFKLSEVEAWLRTR